MPAPDQNQEALSDAAESFAALSLATSDAVARTTLGSKQRGGIEILARKASWGQASHLDIVTLARSTEASSTLPSGRWNTLALHLLGRTLAGFARDAAEQRDAISVLSLARKLSQNNKARAQDAAIELQLALELGDLEYVRARLNEPMAAKHEWALRCDLAHPAYSERGELTPESTEWWQVFNSLLRGKGVSPVGITPGTGPAFDRLTCPKPKAHRTRPRDPLVTIIMPVFEPRSSFTTALRSIREQTWTNLQILVVDDGNTASDAQLIKSACAEDPRIEYIRQPTNSGTYLARNRALTHAEGTYIGFQDADDWSHPERIARQVKVLENDPTLVASISKIARVQDDLRITLVGRIPYLDSAASLLFRENPVVKELGGFDSVRKSADAEFTERLRLVFGDSAVKVIDQPLGLCQRTEGSLSLNDFSLGWRHPDRIAYRDAFTEWHSRIQAGLSSPRLDPASSERMFVAPREFLGETYDDVAVDVHIIGDLREQAPGAHGLVAEARALAAAGLRVAVTSKEAMTSAEITRTNLHPKLWQAALASQILVVPWEAPVKSKLLLVREPSVFTWDPEPIGARADRVVFTAPNLVVDPLGYRAAFDPIRIEERIRIDAGLTIEWLPETAQAAAVLHEVGAKNVLSPHRLQVTEAKTTPTRPIVGEPVVGISQTSQDGILRSIPAAKVARDLAEEGLDVRLFGTASAALRFTPSTLSENEFFDQIDIFLVLVSPMWGSVSLRSAMVALSRGCIVVADQSVVRHLNGHAEVLDGRPLASIIKKLASDPDAVLTRKAAGREWCTTQTSDSAYVIAVSHLLKAKSTHV